MILDENEISCGEPLARRTGGAGQEDPVRPEPAREGHRGGDLRGAPAFVEMEPAREERDSPPPDRPRDDLPRMARCGARAEPLDLLVTDPAGLLEHLEDRPE